MTPADAVAAVRGALTDDLRRPPWRGLPNPMEGHCYIAAEAAYHLLGGAPAGWTPINLHHEGGPHWALRHADGTIVDPTADQFDAPPDYTRARGRGFLTRKPSRRAAIVMLRCRSSYAMCSTPDEAPCT